MADDGFFDQDDETVEAPAGPDDKKDNPKKFHGAQNPPADSNPDVVKAKAKVNPQDVGAVLAGAEATKPINPLSDDASSTTKTEIGKAATDAYMKDHAPLESHDDKPMRNADTDEDTGASDLNDADDNK